MTRPNGLAFSPDYKRLYVSNSDEEDPYWLVMDMDEEGKVLSSSRWLSAIPFKMNGTREGEWVDFGGRNSSSSSIRSSNRV